MTSTIDYKDTIFKQSNLTPIRVKPTLKTLHELLNDITANAKYVYSNIGGGVHGHLGLVLTDTKYVLISPTPFVYPDRPGPILILDSTTAHVNSNIQIAHTKEVLLLQEVTGV